MRLIAALVIVFAASGAAARDFTLADLAFLEGEWRGDNDGLIVEEVWSGRSAGTVTGMARGYKGATLNFLRYTVLADDADGVVMRFKHYDGDYSTWEAADPAELRLMQVKGRNAVFKATDEDADVRLVRYRSPAPGVLQVEGERVEQGDVISFAFSLSRAD